MASTARWAIAAILGLGVAGLAAGTWGYDSRPMLGLRAMTGQPSGTLLHAVSLYGQGDIPGALITLEPVVADGYVPALGVLCQFVNDRDRIAATEEDCVTAMQDRPEQRLTSLTDLAIWAQEWDVAAGLLDQRLAAGDLTAHFDRARLTALAPASTFDPATIPDLIQAAAAAEDPRGQYAQVVAVLSAGAEGALTPVLAQMLVRQPKLTAADAYFELAKLVQARAVSSDLDYVEILSRADRLGNPHAARYLAQYHAANPAGDPDGAEQARWMAKAASGGDPVAQFNRAVAILGDPAADAPRAEAVALLDRSAATGFVPALNTLGITLWQEPSLMDGDAAAVRARAIALLEQADAKADANAAFNLGSIALSQGDRDRAVAHFTIAASRGKAEAADVLAQMEAAAGR
ncbi:hypothetical protein SAMN04488003_1194 [Loktanella fryxellensis]|uniref:TPR repeat n=1 Tax=Loktanella fryxellensis TaxID=245187 RepID=A0A1H8H2F9_9RHOB|nr:sel1 repeat family protein [Loktanella fryxellensis]SEN50154.1 hypothetical protein SAMN04488003_1194 [Loktanella fryxellensis]